MDATRFDRIAMIFAEELCWGDLMRLLSVTVLGASALVLGGADVAEAKRRRKKRKRKKNKKKRASCTDGRKNGSETDVDCGGSCPRCRAGKTCVTRDDCTTALCEGSVCISPDNNDDCGLDTNEEGCFARDSVNADRFCSRQQCTLFSGGSCDACSGEQQCAPAGGNDIECCAPCGSPL
jgi:hypothetical protein